MNKIGVGVGKLKYMLITKEIGEKFISGSIHERKLKTRHVELIKKSIVTTGWNNSSTIAVTESGELLDGQHRLYALKELGWPSVVIPVCCYKDNEVTDFLRSSFNKAAKQTLSDTMKMVYGWNNSTRRSAMCSDIYQAFLGPRRDGVCDDYYALEIFKVFEKEISEFEHNIGGGRFNAVFASAFSSMMIYKGDSCIKKLKYLRKNAENRFNCVSNTCIEARIYDFMKHSKESKKSKYTTLLRICIAINMYLDGKRSCKDLATLKLEKHKDFIADISSVIRKNFENNTNN